MDGALRLWRRLPEGFRELVLYGLASAVALAVDWGLLVGLARAGVNYLLASAAGFVFGVAVAYALSISFVFRARPVTDRRREFLGFLAVGLAGLLLTQALMALWVEILGLTPGLAKAPTAAVVFLFNFSVRRALLFRASGVARP